MKHEYMILHGCDQETLSEKVNTALANNWELWGNPFSAGAYTINQAVVRQVEGEHESLRMAQEPAGYTVQVPVLEEFAPRESGARVGEIVTSAIPLFAGILCTCAMVAGDDPDCEFHKNLSVCNLVF